jgi:DNA-binding transcriptional LysR family regulator
MDHIKSLRAFCKVSEAGGFAAAARSLDMSPAAVTRLVMDLEDRLGTRLLNRTTRSVHLTEAGDRYLETVSATLRQLDEADAEIAASSGKPRGQLRIAAPPMLLQHQLVDLLPAFRARHPDISVHLASAPPARTPDPSADLTFLLAGDAPLDGDFIARRMAVTTAVLCGAPTYLAQRGHPSEPQDLAEHECLIPPHPELPREFTLTHADTDRPSVRLRPPQCAVTASHPEVLIGAALAGLGLVAQVSYAVQKHLARGELVRLLPRWHFGSMNLYATMPSRRHVPHRVRLFLDYLAQRWGDTRHDPWLPATPAAKAALC